MTRKPKEDEPTKSKKQLLVLIMKVQEEAKRILAAGYNPRFVKKEG